MNRWGAICAIILGGSLIFFQNFSIPGQSSAPVAKLVMPAQSSGVAKEFAGVSDCPLKNTIFLLLKGAGVGEHVTGTIEDLGTHSRVALDIVVGRESVVGECEDRTFHEDGVLKICFPAQTGPYFEARLKGDSFELASGAFATAAHCESSPTISVDLSLRGGLQ